MKDILQRFYTYLLDVELNTLLQKTKIEFHHRSKETSTDHATTESAMLEYFEFEEMENNDLVVLLQLTSPLTTWLDINDSVRNFKQSDYGGLVSVVPQNRFMWTKTESGEYRPWNYSINGIRPRTQDMEPLLIENGAIYITKYRNLIKTKNRVSYPIHLFQMHSYQFAEVLPERHINLNCK